jgi:hypothetical protein
MRLSLTILTIILLKLRLMGQDSIETMPKMLLGANLGYNIPLTLLLNGDPIEHLLLYDDATFYWQIPSFTYFFNRRWGIELNFNWSQSKENRAREMDFQKEIEVKYENQYFVETGKFSFDAYINDRGFGKFYLGLVHRFKKSRFVFNSKIFIGTTSFSTRKSEVQLKEKNTNNLYLVSINAGKIGKDIFTTALSSSTQYKLSNKLYLNFDITLSYFKSNLTFFENTQNLNLNTETSNVLINRKKDVFNLSIGAGIVIPIKRDYFKN